MHSFVFKMDINVQMMFFYLDIEIDVRSRDILVMFFHT